MTAIIVPVDRADVPFGIFPITKHVSRIRISNELLADVPQFHTRTITDLEWAIYVARLVARRLLLNSIGASPGDKVRLTWKIKRALRGNPHFTWTATTHKDTSND